MSISTLKTDSRIKAKGIQSMLIKRTLGPFRKRRKWLARTQWMTAEQINELQTSLMISLIENIFHNIPFYRSIMDSAGLTPSNFQTLQDIQKMPILNKDTVRNNLDAMINTAVSPAMLHKASTGGTSSHPLPVYRDWRSIGNEHAFVRRQFDWAGLKLNDRCAYLTWRKVSSVNDKNSKYFAYDPAMHELILSTYHLSQETAEQYLHAICRFKVKALVGYPSAIYSLAKFLGHTCRKAQLKAVLTSSEVLDDDIKAAIESRFGCPVFDFYGSAERTCYIHTCEKGSYHIIPEYGITELIPSSKPYEAFYKIVATGFWNNAMPFIRYDTQDMVSVSDNTCTCGRNYPVIDKIIGRESNTVTTRSGRKIGSTAMYRLCKNACSQIAKLPVTDIGVRSTKDGSLTLEYVPADSFSPSDRRKIHNIVVTELPNELSLSTRRVSQLTKTKNGKCLSIIYPVHK
ncbi:Phenylacetate-coenzyme A ligase [Anaerohalosphaera lusitana]|uniref:Phenylacetate-coenzyme A ligase n=1 Tax=Anaerohalosphaera lusitana TaxID=1936003 RepID=A0A1U9NNZ7_9BACT|nr:phenylacetate--CoA ligase family protein [Anaerohalosphaera lusitana]AQT69454.1 Phenylacetate-coenzyme A ligase [Anaerohalosphaera lusitana]